MLSIQGFPLLDFLLQLRDHRGLRVLILFVPLQLFLQLLNDFLLVSYQGVLVPKRFLLVHLQLLLLLLGLFMEGDQLRLQLCHLCFEFSLEFLELFLPLLEHTRGLLLQLVHLIVGILELLVLLPRRLQLLLLAAVLLINFVEDLRHFSQLLADFKYLLTSYTPFQSVFAFSNDDF